MTSTTDPSDRPNVQMAATVDIAIELFAARGRRNASTFLDASGASFATIVRVLAEPGRRRAPLPPNVLPLPVTKR
jgi:hypothetical protein